MAATKVLQKKNSKIRSTAVSAKPKKLSKMGEWMEAHPKGIGVIYCDMRAVMK